jgi:secretory lipase
MSKRKSSAVMVFAVISALAAPVIAAEQRVEAPSLPVGPDVGDQDLSPFYRWKDALPDKPGILLREEAAPQQPEITAAGLAQRILYTSTDVRWHAGIVPVSGTLYLPKGEPPAGGWPLVAWAHGTLGVSDRCAPSWAGHRPRDATYINRWLDAGFAVVATDYQGLGGPGPHTYLIWEAEGRAVLDSIRVALASQPGRLATKAFITGQSQGSGAALGATRIASTYAPELPLLATVATGIVSTFPSGPYKPADLNAVAQPHYMTLMMLGGGLPDNAPPVDSLYTEKGKPLLKAAREGCNIEMREVARKEGITAANAFVEPIEKIMAGLLPATDMTPVRMPVPVMLGTGLADHVLVPRRQFGAVSALCAAGSEIVWKTYPGITHNGSVNAAFDDARSLFREVLAGQKPTGNCADISEPGEPGAPTAGIPFND